MKETNIFYLAQVFSLAIIVICFGIHYYQDTMQELTEIHNSNDNALNWESVSRMELAYRLLR